MPEDREHLGKSDLSLKLKTTEDGQIDWHQAEPVKDKLTQEQRAFVVETVKNLKEYKDKSGATLVDHLESANRAFVEMK